MFSVVPGTFDEPVLEDCDIPNMQSVNHLCETEKATCMQMTYVKNSTGPVTLATDK